MCQSGSFCGNLSIKAYQTRHNRHNSHAPIMIFEVQHAISGQVVATGSMGPVTKDDPVLVNPPKVEAANLKKEKKEEEEVHFGSEAEYAEFEFRRTFG